VRSTWPITVRGWPLTDAHIRITGALRSEPAGAPLGGLWIVEAGSKAEVEALLVGDPFWKQGLRASVDVWHWSRGFPENPVTL
jgi:uncharacterized protein